LCTLVSQILIDRVTAPIFAQGLDGGESGPACGICILNYLLVAIIFSLAGAVTVAWCGKLLPSQDKASKTAVVAGVAACAASSIILFIPVLLQQIHNNDRIFSLGIGYTVGAFAIMATGGIIIEVIYLFIGAFFALAGGNLYYRTRGKKASRATPAR
jgi:hypothetical protein